MVAVSCAPSQGGLASSPSGAKSAGERDPTSVEPYPGRDTVTTRCPRSTCPAAAGTTVADPCPP